MISETEQGHPDYSWAVWQYFNDTSRAGRWDAADIAVRASTPGSRAVMAIQARLEAGRIRDTRFQVYGCVSAIACGAWLAEWLVGKTPDELASLNAAQIDDALELSTVKRHCALLAEDALRMIAAQWSQTNSMETLEAYGN